MLKLMVAFLVLFLSGTIHGQESSDIKVIEVFHAETTEELEAALVDGYPMPWLEEILNDESIPEEDRYWLDCRVRAVIAQDLHLFFDLEGNQVQVDADWIRYGESYWQEHFILNPFGEHPRGEINENTGLWGEMGYVYNRFGEQTGELVLCEDWMKLSRDGSVGILVHRGTENVTEYGPVFLYFVYSDGSFNMYQEELWIYDYTLSQSGEYALLVQRTETELDPIQMFNRSGECIWQRNSDAKLVSADLSISPDDRFCCIPSNSVNPITHHLHILDSSNGDEIASFEGLGVATNISPNSEYLCIGSATLVPIGNSFTPRLVPSSIQNHYTTSVNCDNSGCLLAYVSFPSNVRETFRTVVLSDGKLILNESCDDSQDVVLSPNGVFVLSQPTSTDVRVSAVPLSIWRNGDLTTTRSGLTVR